MIRNVTRRRFATTLLASCGLASSAMAQQAPTVAARLSAGATAASPDTGIADIIVTAQKRNESLLNVPLSVTAVSGQQMIEKGITNVQDLVKVTPGLSYVDTGRGAPVFSLRGVGFFDQSIGSRPTVSVYTDEAPIPFSIEAVGASLDLQRVEVLKGPQGTLFGQNATGGAINYIAAKPTDVFAAGATVDYGRFNTVDAQGYVSGPVTPTLDVRVTGRITRGGEWQSSYTRHDTLGAKRFYQGRVIAAWKPIDGLKISLNVNGFYDGGDTQAPQYSSFKPQIASLVSVVPLLAAYPTAPANDRAADWNPGEDYRRHNGFVQSNLRIDYELTNNVTLTSLTSGSHEHIRMLTDGDGTALNNYDIPVRGSITSVYQEFRLTGSTSRLDYILGANYAHDETSETNGVIQPYSTATVSVAGSPTPIDYGQSNNNQAFDTKAVYGDVTYALSGTLKVQGGLRYTDTDLHYNGCFTAQDVNTTAPYTILGNQTRAKLGLGPLPLFAVGQCLNIDLSGNPGRFYGRLHEHNLSWRAGVQFKPTTNTLLYANVSKGYKAGSSPAASALNSAQFTPVKQESILAYEAGFKSTLLNRKIEVTGAGFYYDYRDKQLLGRNIFVAVLGPLSALVNVPKSRVYGAEGQITVRPVRGLSLSAAGTYLNTKVVGSFLNYSIIGVQTDFKGSPFPYTPKWQLVFDGEYDFPISSSLKGVVGGNANYRTATIAGFGTDPRLAIGSYWLVDLRAGIGAADGKWKVQLYGRNVTNQYYWSNVAASVDNTRRFAGVPATYGVQFSYKF